MNNAKTVELRLSERDITPDGLNGLIKKLDKAFASKPERILLNLSAISTINSGTVGVIIRKHKDFHMEGGGIALTGISENLMKICENSGILKIIPVK